VKPSLRKDNPHEAPEERFICQGETKPEELNRLILGGGTGGTIAAWTFAQRGQRGAVIERKYISGSCPNIACLPSKNVTHSAKVASYLRRSEEFGIAKRGVG
jgi:pyruvate/2-oxoglutarate dehydrogenase complex dihydrolipoamide dehydrogenase (E3) component